MDTAKPVIATAAAPPGKGDHPSRRYARVHACVSLLREILQAWTDHRALSMGAALAFYATFSIAPVLVIAIAVAGSFFGPEAARGEVVAQIRELTGEAGAETIQGLLAGAYNSDLGFWASMIAAVMLLVAATSMFAELKDSLDVIWGSAEPRRSGIMALLHGRLLSIGLILIVAYLLLISLVVSAALAAAQKYWGDWFGDIGWVLYAFNAVFSFTVVFVLFAAIYKWLPDARIAWRDVAVGSLVTAGLFTIGKFVIGLYLGNSGVASGFGAAGALIVILLWVYYSSQILFLGAEFTRAYAARRQALAKRQRKY